MVDGPPGGPGTGVRLPGGWGQGGHWDSPPELILMSTPQPAWRTEPPSHLQEISPLVSYAGEVRADRPAEAPLGLGWWGRICSRLSWMLGWEGTACHGPQWQRTARHLECSELSEAWRGWARQSRSV